MAEPTTIAPDTAISGRLEGDGDLIVHGRVDGTIEISERLTIGPQARVSADIRARTVVIEGGFQGDLQAQESVVLASTARVIANIESPLVEMADGARLRGELDVGVDSEATPARQRRPATTGGTTAGRGQRTAASPTGTTTRTATATASRPSQTTTTVVEERAEASEEAEESDEADGAAVSEETIDQYRQDFTVKELRDRLRDLDLRVSGTKDELIERLVAHTES